VIKAVTYQVKNKAAMRRLEQGLRTAPDRMRAEFTKTFHDWGNRWHGEMVGRIRDGSNGLHNRSGRLRNALSSVVSGAGTADLKLRLTSGGVPYAPIHEFGGVVRPKRARFLCIPTEAAKTAAGVVAGPFQAGPRAFIAAHPGETFFLRKNGKLLLMWKTPRGPAAKGAKGEAVALWYLVRQVTIPPRLGFFDTWKKFERERRADLQKIARAVVRIP